MVPDFLDRHSRGTSVVHRLDARIKLLATIAVILAIVIAPLTWWPVYATAAGIVLVVYALSRVPWQFLVLRLLSMLPFLLIIAASIPLSRTDGKSWPMAATCFF